MKGASVPFAARPALRAGSLPQIWIVVAVLAAALVERAWIGTASDVSWLITIGEKMLDGQRLYADIVEVNPPASAYLYLPAVAIAHALGLAPEFVVNVLVFLAAGVSLWLAGRILLQAGLLKNVDRWALAALAAAILTILPAHTFGQREHVAVITLLPLLAVAAARARKLAPDIRYALLAGMGAGIAVVIKPHFVIAAGLVILTAAYCARSWRVLFAPENLVAAALAAAYGAFVVLAYPEFIRDMIPLVQAVYVPVRQPWLALATGPAVLCWLAALGLLWYWRKGVLLAPPYCLLIAASIGFAAAYFIQGKAWPYHSYPMLALAFLALAVAGLQRETRIQAGGVRRFASMLPVAALAALSWVWLNLAGNAGVLAEPIRKLGSHPKMLVIASDISIGHPLVRDVNGMWVSRVCSLWISAGVRRLLAEGNQDAQTAALLRRYAARDRDMLAEDIDRARPDIIVVEKGRYDWEAWARSDSLIAERLKPYRPAQVVGNFTILRRED